VKPTDSVKPILSELLSAGPRRAESPSRIAVVGSGYVGLTTGVCLAWLGHEVVCADIDEGRIEMLEAGRVPFVEAGVGQMLESLLEIGRIRFVVGAAVAAGDAEVVFIAVPTPQDDDGSADLAYVRAAAAEISSVLVPGAIVVNKSTVPVGSTREVAEVIGRDDVVVVSNPEFLREGNAVVDFLSPDRVVVGAHDLIAAQRVMGLYAGLDTEMLITDPVSAETVKYAANGFLAMKISFVNAVAAMCEAVGADVADVVRGIGLDSRIGSAFLNPGPGWGGSCFPKDSRALVRIAEDHGYDFSMMRGVIEVNDQQRLRMVAKIVAAAQRSGTGPQTLSGIRIGVLGLTFKAGTDDLRESPSLAMIELLRGLGAEVAAHDPTVSNPLDERRAAVLAGISLAPSAVAAAQGSDIVVIATEWPEYRDLDLEQLAAAMRGRCIVDTRNLLEPAIVRSAGLDYDGVGRR